MSHASSGVGTSSPAPALIMKIGSFQLENLLSQRTRFVYLDLRLGDADRSHRLLSGSIVVDEAQVFGQVATLAPSLDFPVVLVCENGERSMRAALALDAAGYSNVFVVRDGFAGL